MATDYAQLRATDPAAYQKLIQQQGRSLAAGLAANAPKPPAPQPSSVPAPMNTPTNMSGFNSTMPGTPSTPSVPAPKDMSGFKSTMPNMGIPTATPSPVPAPTTQSTPAPGLTRTGNSVSGQLTPEQVAILNSLPPEARHNYIMGLTGNAPTAPGMPTSQIPAPNNGYGQSYPTMSPDQIKAEVAAKIAAETARRATAASQAKTGIQTSYNRLKATTNDTRTLENVQNDRSLNPFSGRSDYAKAMIGREREISDRQQSEDLQTRLANIDVSLQDYINATPEQQRAMENELTRQERDDALQTAQLTGNFQDGTRTLAASSQDFNQGMANKQFGLESQGQSFNQNLASQQFNQQAQNQKFNQGVTQAGLTGYYNPNSNQIQQMQANSAAWANASPVEKQRLAAENQKIGASIGAKQDANGDWVYPQAQRTMAGQNADTQAQQYNDEKAFREQRASVDDQKWLANYERQGQEFAASQGLQWANLDQRQREFVADQGYREQQTQQQNKEREFDRGVEIYKATGQMPSFMSNYGIDVQGLSSPQYADDLNAMYEILSSGQAKPEALIKSIDDKVKIGAERPEDGARMKQAIYKLYPNLDPANKKQSSGENPMLSTSGENGFFNGDWLKRAAALGVWGISRIAGQ